MTSPAFAKFGRWDFIPAYRSGHFVAVTTYAVVPAQAGMTNYEFLRQALSK